MDFINFNRPKIDDKPASGKLLIAEPFLGDPGFSRAVVLLCEHGDEGSVGFILNQATEYTLGDLLPDIYTPELKIYKGGPVQADTLHMLHRLPEQLGGIEVAPNVFWGGSYEGLRNLIVSGTYSPDDLHLFLGYSGWAPEQLVNEMKEGSWLVTSMVDKILFDTAPENIWKRSIALLGPDHSYLANMPTDPQLN